MGGVRELTHPALSGTPPEGIYFRLESFNGLGVDCGFWLSRLRWFDTLRLCFL